MTDDDAGSPAFAFTDLLRYPDELPLEHLRAIEKRLRQWLRCSGSVSLDHLLQLPKTPEKFAIRLRWFYLAEAWKLFAADVDYGTPSARAAAFAARVVQFDTRRRGQWQRRNGQPPADADPNDPDVRLDQALFCAWAARPAFNLPAVMQAYLGRWPSPNPRERA